MESERLLVWLALVPDGVTTIRSGMLCRRHADAMVVPRGWTLDDRRETAPRLFRVPEPAIGNQPSSNHPSSNHPSRGRKKKAPPLHVAGAVEPPMQLAFDEAADALPVPPPPETPVPDGVTVADIVADIVGADSLDPDETKALPWRPVFDDTDDLGGLLKATSPLLSRAFGRRDATPPRPDDAPRGDVDLGDA